MSLHELARSPASLQLTVRVAAGETWDPTTVTSAELAVKRGDGTETTWTASIVSASATQIVLSHVLAADGSDIPRGSSGTWAVRAKMTLPSGTIYSGSERFSVAGFLE